MSKPFDQQTSEANFNRVVATVRGDDDVGAIAFAYRDQEGGGFQIEAAVHNLGPQQLIMAIHVLAREAIKIADTHACPDCLKAQMTAALVANITGSALGGSLTETSPPSADAPPAGGLH